jgi:hypothetical protein
MQSKHKTAGSWGDILSTLSHQPLQIELVGPVIVLGEPNLSNLGLRASQIIILQDFISFSAHLGVK